MEIVKKQQQVIKVLTEWLSCYHIHDKRNEQYINAHKSQHTLEGKHFYKCILSISIQRL